MRDLVILFLHLIVTLMRLARPGGIRSLVAESVLVKHQVLILNRSRKRAPNLHASDRIIAGLCVLLMRPARVVRSAIVLRPSTLFHLHHVLVKRKYRLLFSPKRTGKPGPKGPETELIEAIVQMKGRNPTWGCPRIAQQITLAFGNSDESPGLPYSAAAIASATCRVVAWPPMSGVATRAFPVTVSMAFMTA